MTLVHAETGEVLTDADVIEEMTETEARAFVGRINASLHITGEMIIEAYDRRIWKSLGYSNWSDFTHVELGGPAMNAAQRAVLAVGLRQAGMSLRAIASATGASPQTIMRDTAGATVPDGTVHGLDGKDRPASRPDPECDECGNTLARFKDGDNGGYMCTACEPTPYEHEEADEIEEAKAAHPSSLDELLPEATAALNDATYQKHVAQAIHRVHAGLLTFPPAEIAEQVDADNWLSVELLERSLEAWFAAVKAARHQPMRVINGGKS